MLRPLRTRGGCSSTVIRYHHPHHRALRTAQHIAETSHSMTPPLHSPAATAAAAAVQTEPMQIRCCLSNAALAASSSHQLVP
jgi:hypothetical protein